MSNITTGLLTTGALAQRVGLTTKRINQLITNGDIKAEKLGRDWVIAEEYVEILKSRPENRGRAAKNKKAA
jgi:excisionase family DNA binding protein